MYLLSNSELTISTSNDDETLIDFLTSPMANMLDDFAGDTSTTGVLSPNGTVAGRIDFSGDVDFFAIDLQAGDILRIESDISRINIDLNLENASGTTLATGGFESGTTGEVLNFIATTTETLYVAVDRIFSTSIDYVLTSTVTQDLFSADTNTIGTLPVNGSVTSTIEFDGDIDFIAIDLDAGDIISVTSDQSSFDFMLSLEDSAGNSVGMMNFDPNTGDDILFAQVQTAGTYFVVAEDTSISGGGYDYTITSVVIEDDLPENIMTTAILPSNGSFSSSIDFGGDIDYIGIELEAGDVLTVSSNVFMSELILSLEDSAGNSVGMIDFDPNTGDDILFAQIETDGIYFVVAEDSFFEGAYDYTLSSVVIQDTLSDNTNTTGVLPAEGMISSSIDFQGDVDFIAINLEAGDIVRIESDVDRSDINLSLEDSTGSTLATGGFESGVDGEVLNFEATTSGTFYVTVESFFTISTLDYTLTSTLQENPVITGTDGDDIIDVTDITEVVNSGDGDDIINANIENGAELVINGGIGFDTVILSGAENLDPDFIDPPTNESVPGIISATDFQTDIQFDSVERVEFLTTTGTTFAIVEFGDITDNDINLSAESLPLENAVQQTIVFIAAGGGDDTIRSAFQATNTILLGGDGDDLIIDGNADGILEGNDGVDTLIGGNGVDQLFGGAGSDTLSGGTGEDFLFGDGGDDVLNGNAGDDQIGGNDGNDTAFGGSGNDLIEGNDGNDIINGQSGDDMLNGGAGNDTINGNSGADLILGGTGIDTINGGGGDDTIDGGDASDFINGSIGADSILGGAGNDTINGGNQNDFIFGEVGHDIIEGGAGNDNLNGGTGSDVIIGGSGADIINGDAGNDNLQGNSGGDDLFGGAGNDTLFGGGGNDDLNGGTGMDIFLFTAAIGTDRIQDFQNGIDVIDLSAFALADNFADVLNSASASGANVRLEFNGNNVIILEDFDLADLDASDFIF